MDKTEQNLMDLAAKAKLAIVQLKAMQKSFMAGGLPYESMKRIGEPLVLVYNKYAKALAKARKMPYKPISLGYFLR